MRIPRPYFFCDLDRGVVGVTRPENHFVIRIILLKETLQVRGQLFFHAVRAYGELIQEPEMERKVDVVTHQKWSGANYVDNLLKMVTGGREEGGVTLAAVRADRARRR